MEERCDQTPALTDADSRISRMVGALKGALAREQEQISDADGGNCRSVPVSREFHRPIAYDVDYLYQGAKYRSRLPDDPGNRLRIRIGATPVVSGPRAPADAKLLVALGRTFASVLVLDKPSLAGLFAFLAHRKRTP